MQCPSCRAENPADNTFCGKCATPLAEHAGGPVRYMDAARLARREIVLIVAVIAVIIGGGYASWQFVIGQRGPDAVVRRFIDADVRGDFASLNKYVAPGVDSSIVLQVFQHYRKSTGTSPFVNSKVRDAIKDASRATVDVELQPAKMPASGPVTITFSLSYLNGEWRILPSETVASALAALVMTGSQQFAGSLGGLLPPNLMQNLSGILQQGLSIPGGGSPFGNLGSPPVATPPIAPAPTTPAPTTHALIKTGGTI